MSAQWNDIAIKSSREPVLTGNALTVLERRYLAKDAKGDITETPAELFRRVARFVASADLAYGSSMAETGATATEFYDSMVSLEFIPNTPTLMNAGRPLGQLSACFVLPVEDSIERIFDALKHMALIHKSGGGTGFSFSMLRPRDDMVKSTAGVSSGPVSFMNIFNAATETIKQGGTRRGANMAILSVDHPDILNFISAKNDTSMLTNFNISVALTDAFMEAVEAGAEYELINPNSRQVVKKLDAADVFSRIVNHAWKNGEPGIVFIDAINRKNPLIELGPIDSTNPCGEQPLLPYESCNLGSINLAKMLAADEKGYRLDMDRLRAVTRMAVHFLDNVIDMNRYPLDEIREITTANRKIGLGIMGFTDLLIRLGIPYDSDGAVDMARLVMSTIQDESKKASRDLAKSRGAFPNYPRSSYAKEGGAPLRNATTTTIAPTGTISIIAGASGGIEPIYALAFVRNVMDNDRLTEIHPLFEEIARERGFFSDDIMARVAENGSASGMEDIPRDVRRLFVCAHDISPEWHIRLQAAFQEFTDNAVSKTINFRNDATEDDIRTAYLLSYKLGCKGVTVYRDGSRGAQVLETGHGGKNDASAKAAAPGEGARAPVSPRPRNELTWGATRKMTTGCGSLYVTINEDSEGLFEVFATMGKAGGCAASQTEAVSRLISLSLRSGIEVSQIIKQIKGVRCPNQAWEKGGRVYSCADAIAKALERHENIQLKSGDDNDPVNRAKNNAETNGRGSDTLMVGVCPDCHGPLEFESGCSMCRSCGFSRCG